MTLGNGLLTVRHDLRLMRKTILGALLRDFRLASSGINANLRPMRDHLTP